MSRARGDGAECADYSAVGADSTYKRYVKPKRSIKNRFLVSTIYSWTSFQAVCAMWLGGAFARDAKPGSLFDNLFAQWLAFLLPCALSARSNYKFERALIEFIFFGGWRKNSSDVGFKDVTVAVVLFILGVASSIATAHALNEKAGDDTFGTLNEDLGQASACGTNPYYGFLAYFAYKNYSLNKHNEPLKKLSALATTGLPTAIKMNHSRNFSEKFETCVARLEEIDASGDIQAAKVHNKANALVDAAGGMDSVQPHIYLDELRVASGWWFLNGFNHVCAVVTAGVLFGSAKESRSYVSGTWYGAIDSLATLVIIMVASIGLNMAINLASSFARRAFIVRMQQKGFR
nr:hypothetical protein [Gammaproteobacteria bacterium]